jgi:hypothetical protein
MRPVLYSDSVISWDATLEPFARELPAGTDWIHFGRFAKPRPDIERIARDWTPADERNSYLEQVIPVRFVRDAVIGSANGDLALAVAAGWTVTTDGLHSQVIAQRFGDEAGWKLRGYAIAFLFPQIGGWTWEAIADLRRHRHMTRFRAALREIEDEASAEAARGDLGGGGTARLRAAQRRGSTAAHRARQGRCHDRGGLRDRQRVGPGHVRSQGPAR